MTNHIAKIRLTLILIYFSFIFNTVLSAQTVQLHWLENNSMDTVGVSWGVPFKKGEVKKTQQFELLSDNNSAFQLQTWPMAYWPDGSVKWLGCAAVVDSRSNYRLNAVKSKKNRTTGINVVQNDGIIRINNGSLSCEFHKDGKYIIQNLKINGKLVADKGKLVCSIENREQEDENVIRYEDFESEINNIEVEQTGSVKSVIKVSGVHKSLQNKRELLPFTLRFVFYAGQHTIRMIHTFVYDGDQEKDFIKGLGISFDVPFRESVHNRHVRFSNENGGLWSESVKPLIGRYPFEFNGVNTFPKKQFEGEKLPEITNEDPKSFEYYTDFPAWSDYKLTQLNSNGFTISKRTNKKSSWLYADEGEKSSGLALVGDVSGGMAVSLKDFWQSYPATLEIKNAQTNTSQLIVWLWSKDAQAMDLRHYDTIAHGLDATYEDVQPGLSTPFGIARTSELTLIPFDKLPTKAETVEQAKSGENLPHLMCSPEYLHDVKAFGMWSLPDRSNDTKIWIEDQLDSTILYYQKAIEERHWYGFWNYGDIMHTYDPVRHKWKYDIGGFAWDNTELAPNNWLWYSFLRTGRSDIFKMAEAMTRHTGEVDAYQLGEMKGLGSRHNVSHWGCGSKEARIGQAAWKRYYYYLTTDERCGDLMKESLDAEKSLVKFEPLRIAQPREKFPYNAPMRLRWGPDWLALAGNWMTEWERTGDTKYKDKILAGLNSLAVLPDNLFTGPNGLCYDPETGKLWYDGKPDVVNHNHLATIMGGYEILLELFYMVDCKPFRKTFTEYCKYYGLPLESEERTEKTKSWGDFNFRTPRLTAFAAKELNDDKIAERAWKEFLGGRGRFGNNSNELRNIYGSNIISGSDVLNPVHENPRIGTNGTAQWSLNAIMMLELIGDKIPDAKTIELKNEYKNVKNSKTIPVFGDDMKTPWKKNWFLDGQKAELKNTKSGLLYKAGTTPASDADHSVLWTKQVFKGDIRIEFDFVRKDDATKYVNILYLFAQGSGVGEYDTDISKWMNMRTVPAMRNYFEHMNAYHISFAAFENDNNDPDSDYIRARRYLPERGLGLKGTDLIPDYFRTGLFQKNEKYHITVIKKGDDIFMEIKSGEKEYLCRWKTNDFPDLNEGRIGLRLMGSRVSEFSNFKVFEIK